MSFLIKKGLDTERVYSCTESPAEFLRDSSAWLGVQEVESILSFIEKEYCNNFPGENLIQLIGHSSLELNSWGTLNSVLKMMQKPQDVFVQPERFISYFVSPPPPIGGLKKYEDHIAFELPISTDEFPFVTEYLRSCIEALPCFMNQEMAHVTWTGTRIEVNWSSRQANFFDTSDSGHNINPEFMQSLVVALEKSEKSLKEKITEASENQLEIQRLQVEIENLRSSNFSMSKNQDVTVPLAPRKRERLKTRVSSLRGEVSRISDYLARAQQLVTLLVAQDRMNPQVKEAMRRVDWKKVVKTYPEILDQAHKHFENIIESLNNTTDDESPDVYEEAKAQVQLSDIIDSALSKVQRNKNVQVNKLYFYSEDLPMFRHEMEGVFCKVIQQSIDSMKEDTASALRIVTRPKGRLAEIEITDTGAGIDRDYFYGSEAGEAVESTIKKHKGRLNLTSSKGIGSTFVIDLPI